MKPLTKKEITQKLLDRQFIFATSFDESYLRLWLSMGYGLIFYNQLTATFRIVKLNNKTSRRLFFDVLSIPTKYRINKFYKEISSNSQYYSFEKIFQRYLFFNRIIYFSLPICGIKTLSKLHR